MYAETENSEKSELQMGIKPMTFHTLVGPMSHGNSYGERSHNIGYIVTSMILDDNYKVMIIMVIMMVLVMVMLKIIL